jgi:integrase/recombinase XerD
MSKDFSLSQAIVGFKIAKIAEGYSPGTLSSYESRLNNLARFLGDINVVDIESTNLKEFMYFLRTDYKPQRPNGDCSQLTEASLHGFWKAMRSFWNWLYIEFKIEPIAKELKAPEYTNKPTTPFTKDEIKLLVKSCNYSANANTTSRTSYKQRRPTANRDKAIVLFLLDTGVRVGECVRLKLCDVDIESGQANILNHRRGLKSKGRFVFIGNSSKRYLWRYLSMRESLYENDNLFLNRENNPMSKGAVKNLIRRLGERTGVKANPHKFRHTFAIEYLRNSGDIYTLKKLLGHSTFEMVNRYLAIAQSDIAEAHRRASPVDRWGL